MVAEEDNVGLLLFLNGFIRSGRYFGVILLLPSSRCRQSSVFILFFLLVDGDDEVELDVSFFFFFAGVTAIRSQPASNSMLEKDFWSSELSLRELEELVLDLPWLFEILKVDIVEDNLSSKVIFSSLPLLGLWFLLDLLEDCFFNTLEASLTRLLEEYFPTS